MASAAPSPQSIPNPTMSPAQARIGTVDVVRGLALCGMIVFHTAWDLAYWGWTDTGPAQSPAWMAFGHTVASTFLFVSGFCLVLAHPRGMRTALRRIGILAAAAGIITAATRWLFPGEFIFFGIIHCIALANLVGLGFLRVPAWITLAAGCLSAIAPSLASSDRYGGVFWWCLGLSRSVPATLDYRPLLPWLAAVLFGVAAARLWPKGQPLRLKDRWSQALAWAGRHSLALYIMHQPVLFGLFFLLAAIHPRGVADERMAFSRQCRAQCVAAGAGKAGCAAACDCMMEKTTSRLGAIPKSPVPPDLTREAEACLRQDPTPP